MEDVDLANAIIAAALIQSGQFRLSDFDERGAPLRARPSDDQSAAERFIRQAATFSDPSFDAFESPALTSLRRLTNAIRRALYEGPGGLPPR
jgi:hypothetical protein